ncbi:MAG: hypothetical protein ABI183_19550 [Polyangiaceae bacterium]
MMRSQLRTSWVLAVIGALALVGACSLNTQPIPPGYDGNATSADAGTPPSSNLSGDSSDGSAKGDDAGTFTPDDAGDDASDGSVADAADSGDI